MSNLNKVLLETTFNWFVEHGLRPHIYCYGKDWVKSPAMLSGFIPTDVPDVNVIVIHISPHASPVEFLDNHLLVRCRFNGVACEEYIPYEQIWLIGELNNPLLTIQLPTFEVLPEQLDFEEIKKERLANKEKVKPKFGVIAGGKM